MKKCLFILTAMIFVFTMAFVACKKSSTSPSAVNPDTSAALGNDHTAAMQSLNDANTSSQGNLASSGNSTGVVPYRNQIMGFDLHAAGSFMDSNKGNDKLASKVIKGKGKFGDSTTLTLPNGTAPGILTSTFDSTRKSVDGNIRHGQIVSHFVLSNANHLFVDTITFAGYSFNQKQIEGTIIVTRTSDSTETHQINGFKVTYFGGTHNTINGQNVWTALKHGRAGSSSETISEYGTLTGTSRAGVIYTATTTPANALYFDLTCQISAGTFPVRGVTTFHSDHLKSDIVFDYGAGTCDRIYTVTIGTYVATLTAPSK